jgi:glycosyltransferase involved in cell wall biosynthesis
MTRLPSLSAFFPAFDEEANVGPMVDALLAVLPEVAARFELIVVDDGSRDRTGPLADALALRHPALRVVHHGANRGYGAAVRSGLAAARHEYVFLTDGDRQFEPAEIARLVPHVATADAVIGWRWRRADPLPRRVAGRAWNLLVRTLLGLDVRDVNCAFKLVRRRALAGVTLAADGAAVSAELLVALRARGARIVEVPVSHRPRTRGRATGGRPAVATRALAELLAVRREGRAAAGGERPARREVGAEAAGRLERLG